MIFAKDLRTWARCFISHNECPCVPLHIYTKKQEGLKWVKFHTLVYPVPPLSGPWETGSLGAKCASLCAFACVFESEGFTAPLIFVEALAMQSLTHTHKHTRTQKHAQHCNGCQGARVKVNKGR